MKIVSIFGTRPEWTKMAKLIRLLDREHKHVIIHTGQHYSHNLDRRIRMDLRLRKPDVQLRMGSGSLGNQLSAVLPKIEKNLQKITPDLVLVLGDTNSTLAGALAASRLGIPVAHIEAGCRSGNLLSPEEQNRRMVDSIAKIHFAADAVAAKNLKREGVKKPLPVGSTGVETIEILGKRKSNLLHRLNLVDEGYALATLHRAENADSKNELKKRLAVLEEAAQWMPVVCPMHPRTKAALKKFNLPIPRGVLLTAPLGFSEFITLLRHCRFALSDSGGIQEEAAVLGRPCLVLRNETEWLRLVKAGKNFFCSEVNFTTKKLIRRLALDENFYRVVCRRKAPGLGSGASKKIARRLRKL